MGYFCIVVLLREDDEFIHGEADVAAECEWFEGGEEGGGEAMMVVAGWVETVVE